MSDRVSKRDGARMGERTIHPGGRVFWEGRWFRLVDGTLGLAAYEALPLNERAKTENCPRYDGRMDGLRAVFYNYGDRNLASRFTVWLHGFVPGEPVEEWPGPACVGGVFHWERFEEETA